MIGRMIGVYQKARTRLGVPACGRASIYIYAGSSGGEEGAAAIMGVDWLEPQKWQGRGEGVDMHASHAVYVSVGGSVDILSFPLKLFPKKLVLG